MVCFCVGNYLLIICTLSRIWRSHIPGRRTKLRQTHTSTASAYRSRPLPAKYCRHESPSPQANVALTCRVRDEQRLRAPPVADTASRGWRSGRNAASVERGNRISGTARVGCNPFPSTKEKRPSDWMISSLCWHLPILPVPLRRSATPKSVKYAWRFRQPPFGCAKTTYLLPNFTHRTVWYSLTL